MISFYPKFGSEEDAPGYGPAPADDKCADCAHYRNLGPQGFCEKFSFMASPEYVCDDFRQAGVVKQSSALSDAGKLFQGKADAAKDSAKALVELDPIKAAEEVEEDLLPSRLARTSKALRAIYSNAKETTGSSGGVG